jgi:molybdopterin-biosynthesis enzyme MoeA-like protein
MLHCFRQFDLSFAEKVAESILLKRLAHNIESARHVKPGFSVQMSCGALLARPEEPRTMQPLSPHKGETVIQQDFPQALPLHRRVHSKRAESFSNALVSAMLAKSNQLPLLARNQDLICS